MKLAEFDQNEALVDRPFSLLEWSLVWLSTQLLLHISNAVRAVTMYVDVGALKSRTFNLWEWGTDKLFRDYAFRFVPTECG